MTDIDPRASPGESTIFYAVDVEVASIGFVPIGNDLYPTLALAKDRLVAHAAVRKRPYRVRAGTCAELRAQRGTTVYEWPPR